MNVSDIILATGIGNALLSMLTASILDTSLITMRISIRVIIFRSFNLCNSYNDCDLGTSVLHMRL